MQARVLSGAVAGIVLIVLIVAPPASAQMTSASPPQGMMTMTTDPLGTSAGREGSGTSWLPDDNALQGLSRMSGAWMFMIHANLFVQEIDVRGPRGSRQFGSINWLMGMAERRVAGGAFTLRAMMSLDSLTVGRCGYPDLFQTGESCQGVPLHDEQHPHDLFMEVAADYRHRLGPGLAFEIYGGPAGEPALGPVAYPHRPSAMVDPIAPISHHWIDSTHLSFGVATAAVYGRHWKVDASAFNGREPDDRRDGFDLAPLDSYSGRLAWLPGRHWSLQVSAGHLTAAETTAAGAAIDITRETASAIYERARDDGRLWATTLAWGRNIELGTSAAGVLAETSLDLTARSTIFARAEVVEKSADELSTAGGETFSPLTKIAFGAERRLSVAARLSTSLGASAAIGVVPTALGSTYGGRTALEFSVFLRVRPGR